MRSTVVHVTESAAFGGAEQAILTLISQLDPSRWSSTLVHHPGDVLGPLIDGATALGVPTVSVPRLDPGWQGIARLPRFVADLRRRRPDIVHAHLTWPLASQYALLGAWLARTPGIVATVQLHVELDLPWRVQHQQLALTGIVGQYIAVSRHVEQRLVDSLDWPPGKIQVIHNAIKTPSETELAALRTRRAPIRTAIMRDPTAPLVLIPARLEHQKGHVHLLEGVRRLPNAEFAFAGDGSLRCDLERHAVDLGVSSRVHFLGHRRDVSDLLVAADLVVLPSLSEGLPLALLEAMAVGLPVIASEIGGVDELVVPGETGLLVPVGDVDRLVAAIAELLGNPALAAAMAGAGRRRVQETFSAAAMGERVESVYERMLS